MRAVGRSLIAIVVGALVGGVLIAALEMFGHVFYPPPAALDVHDQAALAEYVRTLPFGAFASVLAAWGIGTLAGAFVAARLAGRAPGVHAAIVTGLMLAGGIANMVMITHPVWFATTAVVIIVVAGAGGARLAGWWRGGGTGDG